MQGTSAGAGRDTGTTIGIDMGGTFVDCVVRFSDGTTVDRKAATTPDDPVEGILAALSAAAAATGQDLETLLRGTGSIVHGTTLGLNAVIARTGGRVGLLTTRGHEDALAIGRVHQKVAGLRPEELTRPSELRKPQPARARGPTSSGSTSGSTPADRWSCRSTRTASSVPRRPSRRTAARRSRSRSCGVTPGPIMSVGPPFSWRRRSLASRSSARRRSRRSSASTSEPRRRSSTRHCASRSAGTSTGSVPHSAPRVRTDGYG